MNTDSLQPVGLNRSRLFSLMKDRELDGIFLSSPENVFYMSGFPTLPSSGNPIVYALRNQLPYFIFAGSDERISLLGWGGALMGFDYPVDDIRPYFTYQMALDELDAIIQEKLWPGCRVGVESTFPFVAIEKIHKFAPPENIFNADAILGQLRLVKSPAEIEHIRRSTAIVDQTIPELVGLLYPGMNRLELIRAAKQLMIKYGADGVDHVTIAFGTANPEVAADELLEENQIVTLDLGAVYQGYVSDNRRLVYTGITPGRLKDLHRKLCWVVAEMGDALRPGRTFAELHTLAFDLYAQAGVEPMFLHVGHSIGLQVDEHWLLGNDPTMIEPGMVLNIELYSFSEEGVMIGDEETYVVTTDEPIIINRLSSEIIERQFH